MNPEVKALWLAALRSGEYQQTKGKLRRTDDNDNYSAGYCCLGVLCDVAVKNGLDLKVETIDGKFSGYVEYNGNADTLPDAVQGWAGLHEGDPEVRYVDSDDDEGMSSLSGANDDLRWDFSQIADAIESYL
jgi:hypothetical protein